MEFFIVIAVLRCIPYLVDYSLFFPSYPLLCLYFLFALFRIPFNQSLDALLRSRLSLRSFVISIQFENPIVLISYHSVQIFTMYLAILNPHSSLVVLCCFFTCAIVGACRSFAPMLDKPSLSFRPGSSAMMLLGALHSINVFKTGKPFFLWWCYYILPEHLFVALCDNVDGIILIFCQKWIIRSTCCTFVTLKFDLWQFTRSIDLWATQKPY